MCYNVSGVPQKTTRVAGFVGVAPHAPRGCAKTFSGKDCLISPINKI